MGHARKTCVGLIGWLIGAAPALAQATPVALCADETVSPSADGRLFGHLPFAQAAEVDLVTTPPGFGIGQTCRIQRAAAADLTRMLNDAAVAPGVGPALRGVSCYRGIEHQRRVFCARIGGKSFPSTQSRAQFVAPPGFSEHATGYVVDFATRPSPDCPDVDSCIIAQPAGRWLLANARDYGFELSFPAFNKQGVTWEPWHFRWVGTSPKVPGAEAARAVFARARSAFPADPGIADPPPAAPAPIWVWPRLPGL